MSTELRNEETDEAAHVAADVARRVRQDTRSVTGRNTASIRDHWKVLAVAIVVLSFGAAIYGIGPSDDLGAFRRYAIERFSQVNGQENMVSMKVKGLSLDQIIAMSQKAFPERDGWTRMHPLGGGDITINSAGVTATGTGKISYPVMGYEAYKGADNSSRPRVVIEVAPQFGTDVYLITEETALTSTQSLIHQVKLKLGLEARRRA